MKKDPKLITRVGGIRVIANASEVGFILNEIFVGGVYAIHFDYSAVVWDIGMNRGLASLYFASRPNVVAVVAYEPFRPTYRHAQKNFALNPRLARKITPLNFGIGSNNKELRVDYAPQWTGNMRTDGLPRWLAQDKTVAVREESIKILNATEVLDWIMATHPGLPIVAKIDCEGAEYEIIRTLHRSGRLGSIKAMMVEWHLKGPKDLVKALHKAGFMTFLHHTLPDRGMIWAVR